MNRWIAVQRTCQVYTAVFIFCVLHGQMVWAMGDAVLDVITVDKETVVYWNGERHGKGDQTIIANAGTHILEAVLSNGARQTFEIELMSGEIRHLNILVDRPTPKAKENQVEDITITGLTGRLLVLGERPGVDVHVNGTLIGTTSLLIEELSCGEHLVNIGSSETTVTIEAGGLTILKDGDTTLARDDMLTVFDWHGPPGLKVVRGQKEYGNLPITVGPVPSENFQWTLRGADTVEKQVDTPSHGPLIRKLEVELAASTSMAVTAVEKQNVNVEHAYGNMTVIGVGREVSIDGHTVGVSPIVVENVLAGVRGVNVGQFKKNVYIKPNANTTLRIIDGQINVACEKRPAIFTVEGATSGLEVRVNGGEWHPFANDFFVEGDGKHTVALRGAGFLEQTSKFELYPGELRRIILVAPTPESPLVVPAEQTSLIAQRAYGGLLVATTKGRVPVELDGARIGETTIKIETVLSGIRKLRVGTAAVQEVEVVGDTWTVVWVDEHNQWHVHKGIHGDNPARYIQSETICKEDDQ